MYRRQSVFPAKNRANAKIRYLTATLFIANSLFRRN